MRATFDLLVGKAVVTGISGRAMSRGQFIGRTMVFNELFADRYIAKSWDIADDSFETIAEIGYSTPELNGFERIFWKLEPTR